MSLITKESVKLKFFKIIGVAEDLHELVTIFVPNQELRKTASNSYPFQWVCYEEQPRTQLTPNHSAFGTVLASRGNNIFQFHFFVSILNFIPSILLIGKQRLGGREIQLKKILAGYFEDSRDKTHVYCTTESIRKKDT